MWNGSWYLRNGSMVLGSHRNMLFGLLFKNRTCLWVQLDNCLQTQYLKICSNIPSKATLLPASPQSISQHGSTMGAWSFLLNECSIFALEFSTGLAETLPALYYSLKLSANSASQMCMMVWRLSLPNSFPSLFMFHRHYFQYTFHTSTPFQELLTWKTQTDMTEFIRAQASAESNCLDLSPVLLITSGCWVGCLISLNLSYFNSKMGIIIPTSQVWAIKIL